MINILLDCTKLKDMELIYNIGIGLKYILIGIFILIPFITLMKVLYNFFSHITSRRTVKKFFMQTFLSIVLTLLVVITPMFFKGVNEYDSDLNYCLKYTTKTNLNKLREDDKEKKILKENGIEEKYIKLEEKIKEINSELIYKINNGDKNNNEKRSMTINIKENNGKWGTLEFRDGIFYILGSSENINKRDQLLGLNPIFYNRLKAMINDASNIGYKINVVVGYRSYLKYSYLYGEDDCINKCIYMIHPDTQMHSYGISAKLDFSSEAAKTWANNNAYKYGLLFKYDNIIEPSRVVYKDSPTCNSLCEVEK